MKLIIALTAAALLAAPSLAAPCRNDKGKFVACKKVTVTKTTSTTTATGTKCRDAKGHFTKCGTPGAKPA